MIGFKLDDLKEDPWISWFWNLDEVWAWIMLAALLIFIAFIIALNLYHNRHWYHSLEDPELCPVCGREIEDD